MSEWADKNRILSPESSAEPGIWSTDKVPYSREIMLCFTDPTVEEITLMKSAQVSGTECLLNFIGYIIDQDPGPALVVQPNIQTEAKQFSKNRLEPMLRDTPCLRGKTKADRSRSKDPDNTTLDKRFQGGFVSIIGAQSASGLAAKVIRYVLCDEMDRWPIEAGREGDPLTLVRKRAVTFKGRKKIVKVSTPTVDGASAIQREWEASDQRHYFVPCPHCRKKQRLYFTVKFEGDEQTGKRAGGLKWEKGPKGEHLPETTYYECENCGKKIAENHKEAMLSKGEWRASRDFKCRAGFHLNALYSPWVRWQEVVEEFLEIKHSKDKGRMKSFVNTVLGEPWIEEGQRVEQLEIMKRRERWDALPEVAVVLTCAVDVQDNRLEYLVYAWGTGYERWAVDYGFMMGDTLKEDRGSVWDDMQTYLETFRQERVDGIKLKIQLSVCDSGHRTQQVYRFIRSCHSDGIRIYAIKGEAGEEKPAVHASKKRDLFRVGVDGLKKELYDWLGLTETGPGFIHFPIKDGFDAEFFEQLTSEERVRKFINNFPHYVWKKKNPWGRNEALDLTVYNQAAVLILKPNFQAIAKNILIQKELASKEPVEKPEPAKQVRRVVRKNNYVNGWKDQ